VIVPVLNEESRIATCLESVLAQTYPREQIEVIVADGGSTDRTRELVAAVAQADRRFRLIDNPGRSQAAGLNLAVAASRGEVIARLDGHAAWRPWHLEHCVRILEETGADNVGGTMEGVGESVVAKAIALATASPFGMGGARYRYATTMMDTDTVFLGCFRRSALERVGPFNEALPIHEDYELNHRIRLSGGRIIFSPEIPTRYWVRESWTEVARQFFRYGRGKAQVARVTPGVLRPYHLAPPLLVAAMAIGIATAMTRTRRPLLALVTTYAAGCTVAGLWAGRRARPQVQALVPVTLPVLHLSWGLGFWRGLLGRDPGS
jgi:cellulose synthase/poly-beta-1,6-N-acetylglucosamine synthase-like glycosyltransferase